jgi:hypothetical protein
VNSKDVLTEFRETGEVTPMLVFADYLDEKFPSSPGNYAKFFRGLAAAATSGRPDERPDFQFWMKAVVLTGKPNWTPAERFIETGNVETACRLAIAEAYGRRMVKFGQWRVLRVAVTVATVLNLEASHGPGDHDWVTLVGGRLGGGLPHALSDNLAKMGLEQRLLETRLFMERMPQPMPHWLTGKPVRREKVIYRWHEHLVFGILPEVPFYDPDKSGAWKSPKYALSMPAYELNACFRAFDMNDIGKTVATSDSFDIRHKWRVRSLLAKEGIAAEPVKRLSAKMHGVRRQRFLSLSSSRPLTGGVT